MSDINLRMRVLGFHVGMGNLTRDEAKEQLGGDTVIDFHPLIGPPLDHDAPPALMRLRISRLERVIRRLAEDLELAEDDAVYGDAELDW